MVTDRLQRQIDRLLDLAEDAVGRKDWPAAVEHADHVLTLDPENRDATALRAAAGRGLAGASPAGASGETKRGTGENVAQAPPPAAPQSFANGRYTVKRFLDEGGKKRVYLAHDTLLARDVAFALIKTEGLDAEGRARITREAQAMGKLSTHPHIVAVFDAGVEPDDSDARRGALHAPGGAGEGTPYLVTELMAGGDIEALLEKAEGHRLPIEDAVNLALQVTQGLEFAHAPDLVHRDLKPGNLWLTGPGMRDEVRGMSPSPSSLMPRTSYLAKIGDFGLAVSLDRSRLTRAGMMVGTVACMPPEQATGGQVTFQSDLYSLGCMLYEMVCGRPPFVGDETVAIIGQHLNTRPSPPPGIDPTSLQAWKPSSCGSWRKTRGSGRRTRVRYGPLSDSPPRGGRGSPLRPPCGQPHLPPDLRRS